MRWLLHGPLTGAAVDALRRHGHDMRLLADVGLADGAGPAEVLEAAHKGQLDLITADQALSIAPFETQSKFNRTLIYLNVTGDVEQDDAIDRLFERYKRLSPGRLYTVTGSRVKVRQLPTR